MRNFDYLKELELTDLHRPCAAAEENQVSNPDISAMCARMALERIVHVLYELKHVEISERATLVELIDGEPFREFVANDKVMMAASYVRRVGNLGAHGAKVTKKESFFCLLNIYNVIGAILLKLNVLSSLKPFDKALIPSAPEAPALVPVAAPAVADDKLVEAVSKEAVASA